MQTVMILQHISTHTSFYVKNYTGTHRSQLVESLSQSTFQNTAQSHMCSPKGFWSQILPMLNPGQISFLVVKQNKVRPSDKSVPPTLLSYVYPNKHHQLCWEFLERKWVGFSSLNFKHLIWLVLRYLFNEWMEGSIVRECLQYDEGSSTQCLFLCTHYIESLDSWLAYKCLKMRGFSHLSRYNRICWILEALWWLWSDKKCLKMSPLGWVIATM